MATRLDDQVALRLVQAAFKRTQGTITKFAYSYGTVNHVLSCDEMVLASDIEHDPPYGDFLPHVRAAADREAVEISFAVSCCMGFSFRENRSFWLQALSLDKDSSAVLSIGCLAYDFPPVVFAKKGYPAAVDYVANYFRGVFDVAVTPTTRSDEFRANMEMLEAYMLPERKEKPIAFTIDFTIDHYSNEFVPEAATLLCEINTALTTAHRDGGIRVDLRGALLSQRLIEYDQVRDLLGRVPPTVDVQLNYAAGLDRVNQSTPLERSLVWHMIAGRLRDLDVGFSSSETLAAVCSLLPFSTSIETVRAVPNKATDWLWLGYAMFHPRTHRTKWRTLNVLEMGYGDLDCLDLCVKARMWPMAQAIRSRKEDPSHLHTFLEKLNQETGEQRVQASAVVSGSNASFYLATLSGEELLSLPADTRVELCDPNWTTDSASEYVDVIVAGYGAGRMEASSLDFSLSPVATAAALTSSITTLEVARLAPEVVTQLVQLLSPRLQYLKAQGRRETELAFDNVDDLPPTLTAVKGYWFANKSIDMDLSFPEWHQLKSMDIRCDRPDLVEPLVDSLIASESTPKFLHLHFQIMGHDRQTAWKSVRQSIFDKLRELSAKLQSLSVVVIAGYTEQIAKLPRTCGTRSQKLAFLSTIHRLQLAAQDSALVRLGADEVALVFAYVGKFADFFMIHDVGSGMVYFHGQAYPTRRLSYSSKYARP